MSKSLETGLASRIAKECSKSADALQELQERLSRNIDAADQIGMASDLQALDAVQQTLSDLGEMFHRLSDLQQSGRTIELGQVLKVVRQKTLRARLAGAGELGKDLRIELF